MTRVLLLRHAESADPTVFHGAESDIGLGERGRRQAEAIAQVLKREQPAAIVSSAMKRAVATARPIALACGLELQVEPALHERRVGILAGTSFSSSDGVWAETLRRWMADDTAYAPPGAESLDAIRARVLPAWERVIANHSRKSLVVVTHGVVIKVLLLTLLPNFTIRDWPTLGPIKNTAISELLHDCHGWQALRLNDLPAELHDI
jgi:broad specificity phosphatase PhoE